MFEFGASHNELDSKWFAHDPDLVASNARLLGTDPSIALWIISGLPTRTKPDATAW
jgi:hypothetical protein